VEQNYVNINYNPTDDAISFDKNIILTRNSENPGKLDDDQMITTVNLGALAAQHRLESKDEFQDVYVILWDVA